MLLPGRLSASEDRFSRNTTDALSPPPANTPIPSSTAPPPIPPPPTPPPPIYEVAAHTGVVEATPAAEDEETVNATYVAPTVVLVGVNIYIYILGKILLFGCLTEQQLPNNIHYKQLSTPNLSFNYLVCAKILSIYFHQFSANRVLRSHGFMH